MVDNVSHMKVIFFFEDYFNTLHIPHPRDSNIELSMAKEFSGNVNPHIIQCLPLRFVRCHALCKLYRKLLPFHLKRKCCILCVKPDPGNKQLCPNVTATDGNDVYNMRQHILNYISGSIDMTLRWIEVP